MNSYDVFVSFREIDTRRTFVSHLLRSLSKQRIDTFRQEEEMIPENEPASSQMLEAIQECRIAIVVISKNYTASVSCLDQLAMIMECEEKQSLTVIPVLYEVDLSEVLKQADHLEERNKNSEMVMRWRDALVKSIQIYREQYSYWEDEDSYSYIIDRVMIHVTNCLSEAESVSKPDDALSEAVDLISSSCKIPDAILKPKTLYSYLKLRFGLVTLGIALVGAVLGMIAGRFMEERPVCASLPPPGNFLDVKKPFVIPSSPSWRYVEGPVKASLLPPRNFSGVKKPFVIPSPLSLSYEKRHVYAAPPPEKFLKENEERPFSKHALYISDTSSLIMLLIISIGLVTMGIRLVRAAIWTITGRFMDGKKPISLRRRPAGSFGDVQKDKYVTANKLSQLVFSNDSSSLVGMARQMKAMNTLLDFHSKGVREAGIWGVRGVGKTTLARCVYEQISPQFQDHYYFIMKDTKNFSLGRYSTCLLEKITRATLMPTSDSESESLSEVVKAKLGHRKVLLIVDELFKNSQLENIIKFSCWFGPGSRLIVVSHDIDLLVQCEVKSLYEVESLRYDEALQLFSQFAFKQSQVRRGFERLSVRAVVITGRIPLALKVLGSYLRGKNNNEWDLELCRLEAAHDNCITKVSSYIGDALS